MKRIFSLFMLLTAMAVLLFSAATAEEKTFLPDDLPVIYLHIDGGETEIGKMNTSPDHSYRCTGTVDIVVPDGYTGEFEGRFPQESVYGLKLDFIRGRGNGTWGSSKLPYKIKLSEKTDLFGMGKNKHWVLLANYYDNSLLRNWLTEWIGDEMGLNYTPMGVFVDLVMNGEYLGSYYFCEQVRVAKARVGIDELTVNDRDLPAIQGGYLLEFSPDEWESPNTFETAHGQLFGLSSPSFDPKDGGYENDAQKTYIQDYVQRVEDAIFSPDGVNTHGERYYDLLDLQSAADYWWVQEFSLNGDAFRTDSAHLYKERFENDGSAGKLYYGPLWDFDESWGNAFLKTTLSAGFNNAQSIWLDELRTKPEFRELLKERWLIFDRKLEKIVRAGGVLDQTYALIHNSWYRDYERWQKARAEDETGISRNLEEEIEHIRGWVNLRREWIKQNLDRIGILSFTLTVKGEKIEDREYTITCDSLLDPSDIELPEVEGLTFAGWTFEDGTPADDPFLMDRDITLIAVFEE